MCNQSKSGFRSALRDREFDSEVRAAVDYGVHAEPVQVSQAESQAVNYIAPQTPSKRNCAELHREAQAFAKAQVQAEGRLNDELSAAAFQSTIVQDEGLPNDETPVASSPLTAGATETFAQVARELSLGNQEGAKSIVETYVDKRFQPYYLGRGQFDHVRFLKDLETVKGRPLTPADLKLYGGAVGIWTGEQATKEAEAASARGDTAEVVAIFEALLS